MKIIKKAQELHCARVVDQDLCFDTVHEMYKAGSESIALSTKHMGTTLLTEQTLYDIRGWT